MTPDWQWALGGVVLAFLALDATLLMLRRSGGPPLHERITVLFKPTHALPALIQVLLFSYWALYYRELELYLPAIALQVAFAYLVDATLSLSLRGTWRMSFGPVPVTLSTNLFVLFLYGQGYLTLVAITLALASKYLIRHRGRHVLNPSAFGVSMVGLATLLAPSIGYGDSAYEFVLAPNMAEVVLLLALVVQLRLPVVLVSAGAVAGLMLAGFVVGRTSFSPYWAPVTLVIVLLATDPATSPRRPLAQLVYGLLVGVFMRASGGLLEHVFDHDFYGKVLGVLAANALVPWIEPLVDRLPDALRRREATLLSPRYNRAHVALWLVFMAVGLYDEKAGNVRHCHGCQEAHHDNVTPFAVFGEDRRLPCDDNPLFCEPFSFAEEARCWSVALGADGEPCGGGLPQPSGPLQVGAPDLEQPRGVSQREARLHR